MPDERPSYLVAGTRSWNRDVFESSLVELPGQWHYAETPDELRAKVEAHQPRYAFFLHWSWKVPAAILDTTECVVFHMTDVPYGRGGSPLQNLILRGHVDTMLSAIRMVDELDAGPVYAKSELTLTGTAAEILRRAAELSAEMIADLVREEPEPRPQEGEVVPFARRTPADSELPTSGDLSLVHDFIRMLDGEGYPPAFVEHGDFRVEFTRSVLHRDRLTAQVSISPRPG